MNRAAFLAVALLPAIAAAHPKGFHKRVTLTIAGAKLEGLAAMDIDGGERAQLLRGGADANGDRRLDDAELESLGAKLAALATRKMRFSVGGFLVPLGVADAKVDLRGDRSVSKAGLSVAVLLQYRFPSPPGAGMEVAFEDEAPDRSHVVVDVFHSRTGGDAGVSREQGELLPGQKLKFRLGA